MPHRPRELPAAAIAAVLATIIFTWPIAVRFGSAGRVDSGDGRYSIWNVAWVAHALTTDPSRVYDANIFHPATGALAFSEANLFAGALAVPVWTLTSNPHAASNWTILCSFGLAFVVTYGLVRRLTGSALGATVAALAFGFSAYAYSHLAHVQLLMTFGLTLSLLAMHAFVERPTAGRAGALGGAMALTGLACGYYGVFAGLMAGFGVLWFGFDGRRARAARYWWLALGGAAVAAVIVAPFFAPYATIQGEGFERSLDEARLFSVGWRSYFASAQLLNRWMLPLLGQWREVLFPGFLPPLLAGAAAWLTFRRAAGPDLRAARPIVGFYLALAALAVWASLGPDAGLYRLLHETLPLFSLLRAPARFGVLVTLALAVLSGFGAAALEHRIRADRRRLLWIGLVGWSIVGSTVGPLPLVDAPPVNPVYTRLAGLPRAPLIEFPYFSARAEVHRHTEYMLMSTYHWQPLVNGYSDHTPRAAREATPKLATFPAPEAWQVIRGVRARYVVLHWHIYGDAGPAIRTAIANDRRLLLMIETPQMSLYQVLAGPR